MPAHLHFCAIGQHGHVTWLLSMQALFFNHLYDPISLVRDNEVKAAMCSLGVHCQSFNGDVLYEPWEVLAEGARPFTTFATFWNRRAHCLRSEPSNLAERPLALLNHLCASHFCIQGHSLVMPSGLDYGSQMYSRHDALASANCVTLGWLRRVQKMPYPPPIPLPVPTAVPPRPPGVGGTSLDNLGLMSDEEAESNEQLYHSVWLCTPSQPWLAAPAAHIPIPGLASSCLQAPAAAWHLCWQWAHSISLICLLMHQLVGTTSWRSAERQPLDPFRIL